MTSVTNKLIFKPEDFESFYSSKPNGVKWNELAEFAQSKLDQWLAQHGTAVWGIDGKVDWWTDKICVDDPTHKAILVMIEPIEQCKHPKEKVHAVVIEGWDKTKNYSSSSISEYQCECGAKVKPKEFEVVE